MRARLQIPRALRERRGRPKPPSFTLEERLASVRAVLALQREREVDRAPRVAIGKALEALEALRIGNGVAAAIVPAGSLVVGRIEILQPCPIAVGGGVG